MNKKSIKAIFAVICAAAIAVATVMTAGALSTCRSSDGGFYEESIKRINNPDQGFYRPVYVKLTDTGAQYNGGFITDETQLYHLRIDISTFSSAAGGTDKPFTSEALNGLRIIFETLEAREKNAIVRFAYDPNFGGSADKEADFDVLLQHIRQATAVLNDFETAITAIEAGLIGPWGEMHTSKISDSVHTNLLIDEFLKNTHNLPVLVRTPKKIYDYLGITSAEAEDYKISSASPAYRLGMYNDGYLGSDSDLGTYTDRARDTAFISAINERLPYGGEVVVPSSPLHDLENCVGEMFSLSLSYLNVEWNNEVIAKWKNAKYTQNCGNEANYYGQSAFTYIENRIGYRFVLRSARVDYSLKSGIFAGQLKIDNVGFGNLTKRKQLKLIYTDENGNVVYENGAGTYFGESELKFSESVKLESGKYNVYLCVFGAETDGNPAYAVRLANENIWNSDLKANLIGEINV